MPLASRRRVQIATELAAPDRHRTGVMRRSLGAISVDLSLLSDRR
jgi:hypothetical protein